MNSQNIPQEIIESEIERVKQKIASFQEQLTELIHKITVYHRENDRIKKEFLPYYNKDRQLYQDKIKQCEMILEENNKQIKEHGAVLEKLEHQLETLHQDLRGNSPQ